MEAPIAFDEMTGSELLDTVEVLALERRRVEVEMLRAAAQWAAMHGEGTVDPDQATLPGRERLRHYGGPGTPLVASFAGATFGARMGRSTYAGERLIAAALDLQHRLPQLWARVDRLEVESSYAQYVARKTHDLPIEQAGYVDSRVVESADGRITWTRFETLVAAAIVAADPEAARAREEAARREQFARATRSTEHGMRALYLRTDAAGVARLDATVAYLADAMRELGATDPHDHLRAAALVLLGNPALASRFLAGYAAWRDRPADPETPDDPEHPSGATTDGIVGEALALFDTEVAADSGAAPVVDWSQVLPPVTLHVHTYLGPEATGLARVHGVEPVTEAWVRSVLGDRARFTIRPVLDPEGLAPVHAYEIPDLHRQAVDILTPADVFPYGSASIDQPGGWSGRQIDHTVPWRPRGPDEPERPGDSRIGNYGPMTTFHHHLKTHGRWQVQQPFPGVFVWRDPHGGLYLVDHTGTRRLRQTQAA